MFLWTTFCPCLTCSQLSAPTKKGLMAHSKKSQLPAPEIIFRRFYQLKLWIWLQLSIIFLPALPPSKKVWLLGSGSPTLIAIIIMDFSLLLHAKLLLLMSFALFLLKILWLFPLFPIHRKMKYKQKAVTFAITSNFYKGSNREKS